MLLEFTYRGLPIYIESTMVTIVIESPTKLILISVQGEKELNYVEGNLKDTVYVINEANKWINR